MISRKVTAMWAMTMLQQGKDPFGIKHEEIKQKRSSGDEFKELFDAECEKIRRKRNDD